ncbi:MAG: UbiA family prenyltransferase [Gemmatimonadales bacterium]|jgi:geranylgeranylglycerol-phosphate geranylgeranyltransferase
MTRSLGAEVGALVRGRNLVMAAAGVAIGGTLAMGRVALPRELVLAMLSAAGLGAAGNAANDLWDVEADRINKPHRPLPSGALSREAAVAVGGVAGGAGLLLAWLAGRTTFAIALPALVVMLAYSPLLKPRPVVGNVVVALVGSLPLVYGAGAVGDWRAGLVPFWLAALLHLAREIVKDLEDIPGDLAARRRTIPIAWGRRAGFIAAVVPLALFVPVALLPWLAGPYGARYGSIVILIVVGIAAVSGRLLREEAEGARAGLKLAMLLGLVGLLWDRL